MNLIIENSEELDLWIQSRIVLGRNLRAIKGKAPDGSTYSDGTLISRPVNIAWEDVSTGEILWIIYKTNNF